MEKLCLEGTKKQSVTSPSGEALGSNFYVRRYGGIIKYLHPYDPVFGAAREWNNDDVASIVYMIQDVNITSDVDMDEIL